jgi:L-rhamnose mutarotase
MKESGVHNYSIHNLESTNHLFAYADDSMSPTACSASR